MSQFASVDRQEAVYDKICCVSMAGRANDDGERKSHSVPTHQENHLPTTKCSLRLSRIFCSLATNHVVERQTETELASEGPAEQCLT